MYLATSVLTSSTELFEVYSSDLNIFVISASGIANDKGKVTSSSDETLFASNERV